MDTPETIAESRASHTRRIAALFDRVAPRYDALNRIMSLGQDRRWRARLVAALGAPRGPGRRALDLGCGTGDVTRALRGAGWQPVGADPSRAMLRLARAREPGMAWVQADGLHLPFRDGAFGASTSAFVLRNLPDRPACFAELARVLAPGGTVAHLELARPPRGPARALHAAFVRGAVPALGMLSSDRKAYGYLARTVMAVPQPEAFTGELEKAGLARPRVERMAAGGVAVSAADKPDR